MTNVVYSLGLAASLQLQDVKNDLLVAEKTKLKITQFEKVHFLKMNELKLTHVELI